MGCYILVCNGVLHTRFENFDENFFPASAVQRKNAKLGPVTLLRVTNNSMEPEFLFLPRLPGFGLLLRNFGHLLRNNSKIWEIEAKIKNPAP